MEDLLGGLFVGFYILYALFIGVVPVVMYVLQSLGLYTIAQRRGIKKPWLAWVPVGETWILGSIADQYRYVAKGEVKNRRKVLLWLYILFFAIYIAFVAVMVYLFATAAFSAVGPDISEELFYGGVGSAFAMLGLSFVMLGISIALVVVRYIALYDLYNSCNPSNAMAFLLLSIFVSLAMPVLIFILRDKEDGMPPRREAIPEA